LAVATAFGPFSDPYAQSWTSEHIKNIQSGITPQVLQKSGVKFCGHVVTGRADPTASHLLRISSTSGEIRNVPHGRVVFYRMTYELVEQRSGEVVWTGAGGAGVGPRAFGERTDEVRMDEVGWTFYGALQSLASAGLISPPGGRVWAP
jgi:hypothetical protein